MVTIKAECFEKMLEINPLQPLPKPGCGSVRFYLAATAKAALSVFVGDFCQKITAIAGHNVWQSKSRAFLVDFFLIIC